LNYGSPPSLHFLCDVFPFTCMCGKVLVVVQLPSLTKHPHLLRKSCIRHLLLSVQFSSNTIITTLHKCSLMIILYKWYNMLERKSVMLTIFHWLIVLVNRIFMYCFCISLFGVKIYFNAVVSVCVCVCVCVCVWKVFHVFDAKIICFRGVILRILMPYVKTRIDHLDIHIHFTSFKVLISPYMKGLLQSQIFRIWVKPILK
jgi:hypothetical protein